MPSDIIAAIDRVVRIKRPLIGGWVYLGSDKCWHFTSIKPVRCEHYDRFVIPGEDDVLTEAKVREAAEKFLRVNELSASSWAYDEVIKNLVAFAKQLGIIGGHKDGK